MPWPPKELDKYQYPAEGEVTTFLEDAFKLLPGTVHLDTATGSRPPAIMYLANCACRLLIN